MQWEVSWSSAGYCRDLVPNAWQQYAWDSAALRVHQTWWLLHSKWLNVQRMCFRWQFPHQRVCLVSYWNMLVWFAGRRIVIKTMSCHCRIVECCGIFLQTCDLIHVLWLLFWRGVDTWSCQHDCPERWVWFPLWVVWGWNLCTTVGMFGLLQCTARTGQQMVCWAGVLGCAASVDWVFCVLVYFIQCWLCSTGHTCVHECVCLKMSVSKQQITVNTQQMWLSGHIRLLLSGSLASSRQSSRRVMYPPNRVPLSEYHTVFVPTVVSYSGVLGHHDDHELVVVFLLMGCLVWYIHPSWRGGQGISLHCTWLWGRRRPLLWWARYTCTQAYKLIGERVYCTKHCYGSTPKQHERCHSAQAQNPLYWFHHDESLLHMTALVWVWVHQCVSVTAYMHT